jgi:hypothetical protein
MNPAMGAAGAVAGLGGMIGGMPEKDWQKDVQAGINDFAKGANPIFGPLGSLISGLSALVNGDIERLKKEAEARRDANKSSIFRKDGDGTGTPIKRGVEEAIKTLEVSRQIQILEEIADNTRPDINRAVFGGGNIGQLGITQAELAGTKRKSSQIIINAKVRDGFDLIAAGLEDYTAMMVKGY